METSRPSLFYLKGVVIVGGGVIQVNNKFSV